jgi:transposase-like protein
MAWKETCPVDERLRFIGLVKDSDDSFAALCEQFGISRKTGYKWVERYEKLGSVGLAQRRPVAHHPEQNGRHECMHKTLKAEATAPPQAM